jgi:hypothetical protein
VLICRYQGGVNWAIVSYHLESVVSVSSDGKVQSFWELPVEITMSGALYLSTALANILLTALLGS